MFKKKKLKYVQVDLNTGVILGFDTQNTQSVNENWLVVSDEAYEIILNNQGQVMVDVPSLGRFLQNNKITEKQELITKDFLVITHSLRKAKLAKKEKNNTYKTLYVDYGIKYNINNKTKLFPFTFKDRVKYAENIFRDNLNAQYFYINSEDCIEQVTRNQFYDIYGRQLKNQRKWEVYTEEYNKYIDTLQTYEQIADLGYEIELPEEYINNMNEKLEMFEKTLQVVNQVTTTTPLVNDIVNIQQEILNKETQEEMTEQETKISLDGLTEENMANDNSEITVESIIKQIEELNKDNKELIFKQLQNLGFNTTEQFVDLSEIGTGTLQDIADNQDIIQENVKLVEEADKKYKEIQQNSNLNNSEIWTDELQNKLQNIASNKEGYVKKISSMRLTENEKEELKDVTTPIVEGVDAEVIENFIKQKNSKAETIKRKEDIQEVEVNE